MMKLLFIALFLLIASTAFCQTDLLKLAPPGELENIAAQKIFSDSAVTSTVIWIAKEVKPHRHALHTEQVYVLEGAGKLLLGEKTVDMEPGDLVVIPRSTIHALKVTSSSPMKVLSIQAPEFDGKDRIMVDRQW